MPYIGEIAALGTAVTWSACALFFTSASHRIGSFTMSHYRMLFGTIILVVAYYITFGTWIPLAVNFDNWILLGISGLLGFFLTDALLFQSYVDASPRIGILAFNFYPFASALLAWSLLDETLTLLAWIGMAITIIGISWVVLEKKRSRINVHRKHFARGVALAGSAALLQAISLAFAKPAMIGDGAADPLGATIIRALFGGAGFWLVSLVRGRIGMVLKRAQDRRAMLLIGAGAFVGPSLGVWLSMVAIRYAPIGIASTLMALMPVTILPMTAIVYREHISWRAIIGAAVACLGAAVLFNA